jgi:hypothetical protein
MEVRRPGQFDKLGHRLLQGLFTDLVARCFEESFAYALSSGHAAGQPVPFEILTTSGNTS